MRGPEALFASEDHWVTSMGAWFPQRGAILRGKAVFEDFQELSWMGLLLYAITGRVFDENQMRLFEGMWKLCANYPDPRIWNNRVAALAGTARSTATLGISAATAISESTIYGFRAVIRCIDMLYRFQQQLEQGMDLTTLVQQELEIHQGIFGYGRPIKQKDERIAPMLALAQELGYAGGAHIRLAFAIEDVLLSKRWRWRLHINIAALLAALAADQGLSCREYYRFMIPCFAGGMFPCHIDAIDQTEGTLFPLRCTRIVYNGAARRRWHTP
ncbi:MAG: hypothetical protein EPN21_01845 [Methylococcaceae bacterium]|nr:MAG: hypothetical protein EPN21_01845 [Methylococcaceae bacterium]